MNATAIAQTHNILNWHEPVFIDGDINILNRPLTGFLCSQEFPAKAVLPIYDWAKTARKNGDCVLSGFHAPLECDVLEILLAGKQPLVWVVARALPKQPRNANMKKARTAGRLLIVSPVAENIKRPTAKSAAVRNRFILNIAQKIIIGYATPNGSLTKSLSTAPPTANIQHLTPSL